MYPQPTKAQTTVVDPLDHQPLNLVLQRPNLAHQVTSLVRRDRARDDRPADTASATERHLARNVHIRGILVLAQERQVQEDGEGCGVGGEDHNLADAAVEGLRRFVGTLLELTVVGGLLQKRSEML